MRKTTAIILYDNNKILLQHRDSNAPTLANQWGHFGGGVEDNETFEQCVKRECFEELEYVLENPKYISSYYLFDLEVHVFIEKYNGKKLTLHEGDDLGWFTKEEIEELDLVPIIKKISLYAFEVIHQLE